MSSTMNAAEELTSGLSIQSTILKPRMRPGDIRFISAKMFGEDIPEGFDNSYVTRITGANKMSLQDGKMLSRIIFDIQRRILALFYAAYYYFLEMVGLIQEVILQVEPAFWSLVTLLNLHDEKPLVIPSRPTCPSPTLSLTTTGSSVVGATLQWFTRIREFPHTLGNYALKKSLQVRVPKDRRSVILAAGTGPLPTTLGVIIDLSSLVIPPPPELPAPYLDAEKRMVVPNKRDTSAALRARAEWSAAQHTHKAAEIMRACTEAAKLVAWSICLGVSSLVIQEVNGFAWRDLDILVSLVKANLTTLGCTSGDIVRFVNVETKEVRTIGSFESTGEIEESGELTSLQPTPLSGAPSSDTNASASSGTIGTRMTVFLASGTNEVDYTRLVRICANHPHDADTLASGELAEIGKVVSDFRRFAASPEILIKYTGKRLAQYSIDGFPLKPERSDLGVFTCLTKPAGFPAFIRAVESYSRQRQMGSE